MFDSITIHLDGPICTCERQTLEWQTLYAGDKSVLIVQCSTCRTRLRIPNEKFTARFNLRRPYPADIKKVEPAPLDLDLKIVRMDESLPEGMGKVIQVNFRRQNDKQQEGGPSGPKDAA